MEIDPFRYAQYVVRPIVTETMLRARGLQFWSGKARWLEIRDQESKRIVEAVWDLAVAEGRRLERLQCEEATP